MYRAMIKKNLPKELLKSIPIKPGSRFYYENIRGVNIDHIATVRNARGEFHPNPVKAAKFVQGLINSVTIHLKIEDI